MNRDILQAMRVMLREFRLAEHQWDYLLPIVQANLNQTPVPSLANKSPMELFTGLEPTTPLDAIILGSGLRDVGPLGADVRSSLDELRASLQVLHKAILDKNEAQATKAMIATANAEACNVCEGDYVLWSRVDENHHPKLLVTWLGPYRVTQVNEYSLEIEHLLTKERRQVHMSRVKLYAEESFEVTEELLEHISEQGIMLKVSSISTHKLDKDAGEYVLLVHSEGLEEIEASWERLSKLMRECPAVVQAYVKTIKSKKIREALEAAM
ncbi:hypothetical protein Ae201684P_004627 [Aphanomyces euteiches]|uniref:Chromo domain-containing protein n=1 Tax=Aphanomyces euteiches TaxID=100861 RepID=A0A6G0WKN0_9STRA|nr:hypothetical protein Ae201684_014182 [Aphanomyces euteiches]KAH9068930.1 hypothetical protein Ae201684P_004627 [Aphanomyces euteiches]